eukprot:1156299-Pelagomonas_calceolata.AAC.2
MQIQIRSSHHGQLPQQKSIGIFAEAAARKGNVEEAHVHDMWLAQYKTVVQDSSNAGAAGIDENLLKG